MNALQCITNVVLLSVHFMSVNREYGDKQEDARNVTVEQVEVLDGLSILIFDPPHHGTRTVIDVNFRFYCMIREGGPNDWMNAYPNEFNLIGGEQRLKRSNASYF